MFRSRRTQELTNPLENQRKRGLRSLWLLLAAPLVILTAAPDTFLQGVSAQQATAVVNPPAAALLGPNDAALDMATPHVSERGRSASDAADSGHASHADSVDEHGGGHQSVAAPLFAAIVIILLLAKLIGDIFERCGMPAVLGELSVGILLGNMLLITTYTPGLLPWDGLSFLKAPDEGAIGNMYHTGAALKMLAEIGVVLLLFEVGLESNIHEMMKVGTSSIFVALLGVIAPLLLGIFCGWMFLQGDQWQVWLFLGATLCATSVGITARVLKDLGKSQQRESQIILGAAVIDDVLGLIILTVVTGVIEHGENFSMLKLAEIVSLSVGFLFVAVFLGSSLLVKPLFKAASYLQGRGLLVVTSLVICFGMAYLANLAGLAPIVGAFAAGLVLDRTHYQVLGKQEHLDLEEALAPLTALLVPIFFVQMGIMVDLSSFGNPSVWLLAAALTVAAVIGKQVCSLGVREKGLNRTAIGLGMIPRGEVGLIFANVGLGLKIGGESVVSTETYSAIIVMVILTTMLTPPLLKWSMCQPAVTSEQPTPASSMVHSLTNQATSKA